MKEIVVAIDGPGGAGKSTISRELARALGYRYVDTGAMYRIIGVLAAERGIGVDDPDALGRLCEQTPMEFVEQGDRIRTLVGGRDLSAEIRTPEAAQNASRYSAVAAVREHLVRRQREMGAGGGVVMEGRDIGTVVFPDAALKIFLDASPEERARRRAAEMEGGATEETIARMAREIAERDARDRGRAHSPLRAAEDAVVIDSTDRSIADIAKSLLQLAQQRRAALACPG